MRTLADLNMNNLRRFANDQGRTVEVPPESKITGGSTAMGDPAFPDDFECPDKMAYQRGELEDNVLLELAEEKVLGCPTPHNCCFRRLHIDERIRLIRCEDPDFDYGTCGWSPSSPSCWPKRWHARMRNIRTG